MSIHDSELAELQALISGDEAGLLDDPPELADEAKATALLGVLGEVREERAAVQALYTAYEDELRRRLAKLWDRRDERLAEIDARLEGIERWLDSWHRAQVYVDAKGKVHRLTFNLPTGTLKLRGQQPQVEIDDEDAFMAWAEENAPDLITWSAPAPPPQRRPDKAKVNAAAKAKLEAANPQGEEGAGMLLPGVLVVVRDRKFTAEPDI